MGVRNYADIDPTYSILKFFLFVINNIGLIMIHAFTGGLTENDFILAAKINGLNLHHLLRKKAAA